MICFHNIHSHRQVADADGEVAAAIGHYPAQQLSSHVVERHLGVRPQAGKGEGFAIVRECGFGGIWRVESGEAVGVGVASNAL